MRAILATQVRYRLGFVHGDDRSRVHCGACALRLPPLLSLSEDPPQTPSWEIRPRIHVRYLRRETHTEVRCYLR